MRYLLIPLVFLAACSRPAVEKPISARANTVQTVSVAKVEREDLARELELAAEFRPWQEIDVHAKITGYIKSLPVDVGDRLREGQLIGLLEVPELAQDLAQSVATEKRSELDVVRARSEVTRAEANLHIRQLSFDRLSGVAKQRPNLIAQQELDDTSARLQEASAQLATARANLATVTEQVQVTRAARSRVEAMIQYTRVTAPFQGVVTARYEAPGAMVQSGTRPLVRLSQVDRLRLMLPVPESIVPRVKLGSPVEIRVDSLSTVVQGKVMRFSGVLNTGTRTMQTEVDVPNPSFALKPGMYAYATIVLDSRGDVLAIPIQAIRAAGSSPSDPRQEIAIVNAKNQVEFREIRLGLETPDQIEVLSGLKENDLVVIGNRGDLKAGQVVEPRPMSK